MSFCVIMMQAFETLYIQIMEIQCRTDDNYAEIFNQMIVMFGRFIHAKLLLLLITHWSNVKPVNCIKSYINTMMQSMIDEISSKISGHLNLVFLIHKHYNHMIKNSLVIVMHSALNFFDFHVVWLNGLLHYHWKWHLDIISYTTFTSS